MTRAWEAAVDEHHDLAQRLERIERALAPERTHGETARNGAS
jgi:hypothetical protein